MKFSLVLFMAASAAAGNPDMDPAARKLDAVDHGIQFNSFTEVRQRSWVLSQHMPRLLSWKCIVLCHSFTHVTSRHAMPCDSAFSPYCRLKTLRSQKHVDMSLTIHMSSHLTEAARIVRELATTFRPSLLRVISRFRPVSLKELRGLRETGREALDGTLELQTRLLLSTLAIPTSQSLKLMPMLIPTEALVPWTTLRECLSTN